MNRRKMRFNPFQSWFKRKQPELLYLTYRRDINIDPFIGEAMIDAEFSKN
jgi:hypothetical protein